MPSQPITMVQGEETTNKNSLKSKQKLPRKCGPFWLHNIWFFIATLHSQPKFIIFADWIFGRTHTIMNRWDQWRMAFWCQQVFHSHNAPLPTATPQQFPNSLDYVFTVIVLCSSTFSNNVSNHLYHHDHIHSYLHIWSLGFHLHYRPNQKLLTL